MANEHVKQANFQLTGVRDATHASYSGILFASYCFRNNVEIREDTHYVIVESVETCIGVRIAKCVPGCGGLVDMQHSQLSYTVEYFPMPTDRIEIKSKLPTELPLFFKEGKAILFAQYDDCDSNAIIVSLNTMIALGCTNGSMVRVETPTRSRHAYVCLSDAPAPLIDGLCLIPYTIFFSLFTYLTYSETVSLVKADELLITHVNNAIVQKIPLINAHDETLCLESNTSLDLQDYFQVPRILKSRDIIRIRNVILHPSCKHSVFVHYQIIFPEKEGILDSHHSTLREQPFDQNVTFASLEHYFRISLSTHLAEYLICGLECEYSLILKALNRDRMTIFRLIGPAGSGKYSLCKYISDVVPLLSIDMYNAADEMPTGIEKYLGSLKHRIIENESFKFYKKGVLHVRHVDILKDSNVLQEGLYRYLNTGNPMVVIETCEESSVKPIYAHELRAVLPNDNSRKIMFTALCPPLDPHSLDKLVHVSKSFNRREIYAICESMHGALDKNAVINDFGERRSSLKRYINDLPVMPYVPSIQWSDIGGLDDIKRLLEETIEWPGKFPALFAGMRHRSGVLLYGPPGTGKTMLAKAVATSSERAFLAVKGPELMDMYVGESERHVRQLFEQARASQPSIIFFDELDALAPQRGAYGDSGGVMDRMVSQLLTEMDRLDDVIVMGATNRPDLVDSALLRAGRFEVKVYVGPSETPEGHLSLLRTQMHGITLEETVHLAEVAKNCPKYLTGANAYSICSNALMNSIKRTTETAKIRYIDHSTVPFTEYLEQFIVTINHDDIQMALENLTSILTENDIRQYRACK